MKEVAPHRAYPLREVFNGLRWIVRAGSGWRMMPTHVPPWHTVEQQPQRWLAAGVFETMVHDLRLLLRDLADRAPNPSASVLDSRPLQSRPESGARAGADGAKRRRGSKVHCHVDTLGHLLTLVVTPANEQDRAQVAQLAEQVQEVTGARVEVAFVDQGSSGTKAEEAAEAEGIRREVVKLPEAKRGVVLVPRRWVVARSFAWLARLRRLARDYERLPETLAGLHSLAFSMVLLKRFLTAILDSS